jgi:hypothetical protein
MGKWLQENKKSGGGQQQTQTEIMHVLKIRTTNRK